MKDQAWALRELSNRHRREKIQMEGIKGRTRKIAITSGKGGVGKTNLAANLALALSKLGSKVLVVDADMNLANLDLVMGVDPKYTLLDWIEKNLDIEQILVKTSQNVWILPSRSGPSSMAGVESMVVRRLTDFCTSGQENFDFILIDTASGMAKNALDFIALSDEAVVITTPEPTSITDAYAIIKIIAGRKRSPGLRLLINMARSKEEAHEVNEKFQLVIQRLLKIQVDYLGHIPLEKKVMQSVQIGKPLIQAFPKSKASKSIEAIAKRIRG